MYTDTQILEIASHFMYDSTPVSVKELRAGNINVTYRLLFNKDGQTYAAVLQRINTTAFHDPDALMQNIGLVTAHIHASLLAEGASPARRVLHFIPADNGSLLYRDEEGGCWRSYDFVDQCTAYDQIQSPELFYEAGRGFGEFQNRLADFPAERLHETIPHFHDTPRRYETFLATVAADPAGRAAHVQKDIAFFRDRADMMRGIVDRLANGELPLRVTHNDTKLNNVLLDDTTHTALCVIDLDTVMPGSALYDYGDAVRYGACTAAEDEPDTDKIGFDMTLFAAFTKGFLSATAGRLTDTELRLLPLGIQVITCELAMRFLTDYLDGDKYFKIAYPEHNLVRARAQMKLLTEVEAHLPQMHAAIADMLRS